MSRFEYVVRDEETLERLTTKYGGDMAEIIDEIFVEKYKDKHPIHMNEKMSNYFNKRSQVFERYVQRFYKV